MDAEAIHELTIVDNDDQMLGGGGNDLFAQECSASALDEIKGSDFDLVSTVDRDVDMIVFC